MKAVVFLASFAAYLLTAGPGIYVDDSGEFCVAALTLGVPHPPGYPLYTLLLGLGRFIPVGSFSMRLNLVGAVLGASAAVLMFVLMRRTVPGRPYLCMAGALLAALATGWWSQAGTAKGGIYMLNLCAVLAVMVQSADCATGLYPAALVAGLSLTNHWMSAAGLVPVVAWLAVRDAKRTVVDAGYGRYVTHIPGIRRAVLAAGFLFLGASLYLCLPLRATAKPFLNWGNPDRISRLVFVVGRTQYAGPAEEEKLETPARRVSEIRDALAGAAPWWVLGALAAVGAGILVRSNPALAQSAFIYAGCLLASLMVYGPIREGAPWYLGIFAIPAVALACWLALAGVALGASAWRPRLGSPAAAVLLVLLLPAVPARWTRLDRSREYMAEDLARNLADHLPARALMFANSDAVVFSGWHSWIVERREPAPVIVPAPLVPMPWIAEGFVHAVPGLRAPYPAPRTGAESVPALLRAWVEANSPRYSFFTFMTEGVRSAFGRDRLLRHGMIYRITARPAGPMGSLPPPLERLRWRGILGPELARDPRQRAAFQPIYFSALLSAGSDPRATAPEAARALGLAETLARGPGDTADVLLARANRAVSAGRHGEAEELYLRAFDLDPTLAVALRNLAMLHLSLKRTSRAREVIKRLVIAAPDSEEAREMRALKARLEPAGALRDNSRLKK